MIDKITRLITRYYLLFFILNLLIPIPLAYIAATSIEFESSVEVWFSDDDPAKITYKQMIEDFGNDQFYFLYLHRAEGVFNPNVLQSIHRMTQKIQILPNISDVKSLTNVKIIEGETRFYGAYSLFPSMENNELPDQQTIQEAKTIAINDEIIGGSLVDLDGTGTLIVIRSEYIEDKSQVSHILTESLRELIQDEKDLFGYEYRLAGEPVIDHHFLTISQEDQKIIIPLSMLVASIISFFLFRQLSLVVMANFMILLTDIMLLGVMGLLGMDLNSLNASLPAIMTAIVVATAIHIQVSYIQEISAGDYHKDRKQLKQAAHKALSKVFLPCFLTSITTSLGFLSLVISPLQLIKEFGVEAALGVMFCFFITITFTPASFILFKMIMPRSMKMIKKTETSKWVGRYLHFLIKYKYPINIITALFVIAGIIGLLQLNVESNFTEFFPEDDPVRQDASFIEDHMTGITNLEFVIEAHCIDLAELPDRLRNPNTLNYFFKTGSYLKYFLKAFQLRPEPIKYPQVLQKINGFENYLSELSEVTDVQSFIQYVKKFHMEYLDGDRQYYRIPDTKGGVSQILLPFESPRSEINLWDYVTPNFTKMRTTVRLTNQTSQEYTKMMEKINQYIDNNVQSFYDQENQLYYSISITETGTVALFRDLETHLLSSLVNSFFLAFGIILLFIGIVLRSPAALLLSVIPNFIPIIFTFGLMGYLEIDIDMGTSVVACVAIGIIVDDTIHFLNRYIKERREGKDPVESVKQVFHHVSRAIIFTSIVLITGFATLYIARMMPAVYMGTLTAFTIFGALVCDLLVLPSTIFLVRRIKQKHPSD